MVKKISYLLFLLLLLWWSCATYHAPPPTFYIDNLPPSTIAQLTLNERLIVEEIWNSLRAGNGEKAKKTLTKLSKENMLYYSGWGYANYVLHDLQTAEDFFKASLRDHPGLILSHLGLAQIYQETGRDDMAFTTYREVLKREPEHPWAKPRYDFIKDEKTKEFLEQGRSFIAQGNSEEGRTAYLQALYYSPQSEEAHLALAEIYNQRDQPKHALVHLDALFSLSPTDKRIVEVYGNTLFQIKEFSRSLEIYLRLLELDPGNDKAGEMVESLRNRLGIFELPSQYNSIPISEAVTKEEMAALIGVKFKDILPSPPGTPPIIIDISTSWASKLILSAASLGILDIYPNHTFQPQKNISRAEMAEITYRLLNKLKEKGYRFIQQIPPETIEVTDVSPDNFYFRPIVMMISYDIMSLAMEKKFNPEQSVSGQEAIRLLDIILALVK